MKGKLFSCVLASALALSMIAPALAAEQAVPISAPAEGSAPVEEVPPALPHSVLYYGQVAQILRDQDGSISRLVMESESHGSYIMTISQDTLWVDSGQRAVSDPATLTEGEGIYVFHSPISTRSLPPQSAAFAVVRNIPQDVGCAKYHVIEAVAADEQGGVRYLTDNGGLYVSADQSTGLSVYGQEGTFALSDLKAGDRVMAWYGAVALSLPGQTHAQHLMLLPAREEQPAQGAQLSIVVEDDMVLPVTGRYEDGAYMVPLAAVAQALGLQVSYAPGQGGQQATLTVESDSFKVQLQIGRQTIFGVTKLEGAVGMTAPQDYGKAPYVVDPGTTWAPAQLFEMLGRTVRLEGGTLHIS